MACSLNETEAELPRPPLHPRKRIACFEHSNFLKVNDPIRKTPTQLSAGARNEKETFSAPPQNRSPAGNEELEPGAQYVPLEADRSPKSRNSTTSFLTAAVLIYAIGAGITAAAGTRLALQLLVVSVCKSYSFQLQDL